MGGCERVGFERKIKNFTDKHRGRKIINYRWKYKVNIITSSPILAQRDS